MATKDYGINAVADKPNDPSQNPQGWNVTVELLALRGLRNVAEKNSKAGISKMLKGGSIRSPLLPYPSKIAISLKEEEWLEHASVHLPSLPLSEIKGTDGNSLWSCQWPRSEMSSDERITPTENSNISFDRSTSSIFLRCDSLAQVPGNITLSLGLLSPGENEMKTIGLATIMILPESRSLSLDIPVEPVQNSGSKHRKKLPRFGLKSKNKLLQPSVPFTTLSIKLNVERRQIIYKQPTSVPSSLVNPVSMPTSFEPQSKRSQEDETLQSQTINLLKTPLKSYIASDKADSSSKTVQTETTSCSSLSDGRSPTKTKEGISPIAIQTQLANIVISYEETAKLIEEENNEQSVSDDVSFRKPIPTSPHEAVSTPLARVLFIPTAAESTPLIERSQNVENDCDENESSVLFTVDEKSADDENEIEVSIEGKNQFWNEGPIFSKSTNASEKSGIRVTKPDDPIKSFEGHVIELSHTRSNLGDLTVDSTAKLTVVSEAAKSSHSAMSTSSAVHSVMCQSVDYQPINAPVQQDHSQRKGFGLLGRLNCAEVMDDAVGEVFGGINDIFDEAEHRLCEPDNSFVDDDDDDDDDDAHIGDDDFQWGSDSNDNGNHNNDKPRKRTTSSNSATGGASDPDQLERLVVIPHGCQQHSSISSFGGWEQRVGCILWHPDLSPSSSSSDLDHPMNNDHSFGDDDDVTASARGNLLTVGWDERSPVCLWDLSSSDARQLWSTSPDRAHPPRRTRRDGLSPLHASLPRRASWNPHHPHGILVASGADVLSHDVRRPSHGRGALAIRAAHRLGVADVSHDHSREHLVLTSGMDGVVKFWDWRMHLHSVRTSPSSSSWSSSSSPPEYIQHCHSDPSSAPLLLKAVRGGHSHWVTRATYNPFYDQLILSAGRDGVANLWRISSCSSAPLLDLDENDDDDVGDDDDDDDIANGGLDGNSEGDGEEHPFDGMEDDKENQQREWMTMGNITRSHDDDDDDEHHEQDDNLRYHHPEMDDDSDERNDHNPTKTDKSSSKSNNTVSTAQDVRVTRYECSDAVADVAWCSTDPWVYATLSCDGGVVVHHVPSKEKYKILL